MKIRQKATEGESRELLLKAPWVMTFPGLAIFAVALGLNLFGDGLRDALDPRRVKVAS